MMKFLNIFRPKESKEPLKSFTDANVVLPGKYAYVRRIDDNEVILTFQTISELLEFQKSTGAIDEE